MCGRYYIDDKIEQAAYDLASELERDRNAERAGKYRPEVCRPEVGKSEICGLGQAGICRPGPGQPELCQPGLYPPRLHPPGDVSPHDTAPVLLSKNGCLTAEYQQWGFPGAAGNNLIFNARAETALEKRLFRDSVLSRRAVIPASKFYEWNRNRDRITFLREDSGILFMAGFYSRFEDGNHYVILTTEANESMKQTHDRMPLLLERDQVGSWILDRTKTEHFLRQKPALLEKEAEYEQISFTGL